MKEKLLHVIRLIVGVAVGTICGILRITGAAGLIPAGLAYILLHLLSKRLSSGHEEGVTGLIEYIGLWLCSWCLSYSILYR